MEYTEKTPEQPATSAARVPVYLHGIATAVPPFSYASDELSEVMREHVDGSALTSRLIRRIHRSSGIETRHSVLDEGRPTSTDPLFLDANGTRLPTPWTGTRNDVYAREAPKLYESIAKALVRETPGLDAADVTHVITVSCTGFFAPGPDYHVVRALGLPGSTERYHLGFMGCYAAFPALRMARAFCVANPEAVVLVICAELCTLHLRFSNEPDDLIAGALFADGAAGALVSARPPAGTATALEIVDFVGDLAVEGESDMAWTIGNSGFRMKLSTYVPDLIQANLLPILSRALERHDLTADDIDGWAIHPGGRAILDRVQETIGLDPSRLAASRRVLRDFGNMSSPTILFVLKEILDAGEMEHDARVFAMAFGPGLTLESGLFRLHARSA